MKHLRPTWPLYLLLVSCGAPSAAPPNVASVEADAAPPGAGSAAAATPADAGPWLPPDVADATNVAPPAARCSLDAPGWRGAFDLAPTAGGAPFAKLARAHHAQLSLLDGGGAFLLAETGSVQVGGFVATDQVRVATRHAVVFGGVFVPDGTSAQLPVAAVAGDRITLRASLPDGAEAASPSAPDLTADVGCADIALSPASYDAEAAAGGKPLREARLVRARKVALSVGFADPPVLTIQADADATPGTAVTVLETRGGRSRIRWTAGTGVVFGWVASADLRAPMTVAEQQAALLAVLGSSGGSNFGIIGELSAEPGGVAGPGPVSGGAAASAADDRVACPGAARVIADVGGRRWVVGRIASGAPLRAGARDGSLAPLVSQGSLEPAPGVRLSVAARDLVGCAATTATEAADPVDPDPLAGDPSGVGGLGLSGVGVGGGITGEGIGLGGIGSLGHGAGSGTGQGLGRGSGKKVRAPQLRQGATAVNGRLPPEVIQRIVRQNFGRFRLCYENGLRSNPNLQGRVTTKFVISRTGDVTLTSDGGSDLPDQGVVGCVVRSFANLRFPQPEGGVVTVVFPIIFSPGD